jgi:hypothetical protein
MAYEAEHRIDNQNQLLRAYFFVLVLQFDHHIHLLNHKINFQRRLN